MTRVRLSLEWSQLRWRQVLVNKSAAANDVTIRRSPPHRRDAAEPTRRTSPLELGGRTAAPPRRLDRSLHHSLSLSRVRPSPDGYPTIHAGLHPVGDPYGAPTGRGNRRLQCSGRRVPPRRRGRRRLDPASHRLRPAPAGPVTANRYSFEPVGGEGNGNARCRSLSQHPVRPRSDRQQKSILLIRESHPAMSAW